MRRSTTPTPRQQLGYLRRLVRRGELAIVDPVSGRPVRSNIQLVGRQIHIVPRLSRTQDPWDLVIQRLQQCLSLEAAEELAAAVEAEVALRDAPRS